MTRCAFLTVTDRSYFLGTLATVCSVFEFHPEAQIVVVANERDPLTPSQVRHLNETDQVVLVPSSELLNLGRHLDAWELKAHAARLLASRYDAIVGINSDCILCSDVHAQINNCLDTGYLLGARDGNGIHYDASYRIYGFETPAYNAHYMSTSLYFCASTSDNQIILEEWSKCCTSAIFNKTGAYPGHGDQGVLNAILFSAGRTNSDLLENLLWSQHNVFWDTDMAYVHGCFRTSRRKVESRGRFIAMVSPNFGVRSLHLVFGRRIPSDCMLMAGFSPCCASVRPRGQRTLRRS